MIMETSNIIKPIQGFNGYFASADGDIYSSWSLGKFPVITSKIQRKLSPGKYSNGYFFVNVRKSLGKRFSGSVHRLVCIAFHGIPKKNETASHLDGNLNNNKSKNLKWESLSENHKRKLLHGTDDRGCKNSRAKINEIKLMNIKVLLKKGEMTHKEIGKIYGVNRSLITKINCGQRYNSNV